MFDWLFVLLTPMAAPPQADYVGALAAEAAYVSLQPAKPVKPTPINPADCKTCKGTGRVRTGDDQGWTKCPDCQPAE
jgi:hypothetical protein